MSVRMTAKKGFTNPRITGPRPDGAVVPGDGFTTDWVHGKELRQLGLAEPDDAAAFDAEPVEMMQPHNQVSEPELRRVNTRRAAAAKTAGVAGAPPDGAASAGTAAAVTGATTAAGSPPTPGVKSNAPAIPPTPGAAG